MHTSADPPSHSPLCQQSLSVCRGAGVVPPFLPSFLPSAMSRPCEWSSRRSECVVLRRLLQPGSFAPHVHVFGPPNTGKTQLVLDVLRLQRCSFAFVDGLTVTSQRAALAAIAAQLSGGQQSQPQPQSASELAVRLRSLPSLLSRTAFIVVKEAAAVAALSGSSNSEDEWLPALLSLPAVCQRHIAVVLIDRGGSGAAAAAVEGCVPVHFSAYSSEQLTAIIGRSLSVPRLAEEESGGVGKEAGDAALLRFVSDAVNTFIGFSRDLRELHRIVSLLLLQSRSQSQSSGGAMEYMLHAMRREVRQVAANAVFRFDYSAAAVEAAPAAGGGLSRHLSLAQYYLLFASYIASHNSTQDDTRVFASEAIKVSSHSTRPIPHMMIHC